MTSRSQPTEAAADRIASPACPCGFGTVRVSTGKPLYARLWQRTLGFKPAPGKEPLYFEGHDEPYIELVKHLTPPKNAITSASDAAILFRIEGYWDAHSEFEAIES